MTASTSVLVCCLVVLRLQAQESKPWEVERLCGKFEHVEKIQSRRDAKGFSEKWSLLRDVDIALYDRRENESWSSGSSAIETVRSHCGGRFEFQSKKPGLYWLVSNWNGKEYKVPVLYKPGETSTTVCSEQGIQIDSAGDAAWWISVTVD